MSNAALPPNPMLEGSIFRETNQNMMQNPQNLFNFPMTPFAPFRTNQGYGLNETRPLDQVPTMQPMVNNTMSSTVTQYNAANLDPKTLHNAAGLIPYGEARGQLSLTSNLDQNRPHPLLRVDNGDMFRQVASEINPTYVPQFNVNRVNVDSGMFGRRGAPAPLRDSRPQVKAEPVRTQRTRAY